MEVDKDDSKVRHTAAVQQILVARTEHWPQPVAAQCTVTGQWLCSTYLMSGLPQGSNLARTLQSGVLDASGDVDTHNRLHRPADRRCGGFGRTCGSTCMSQTVLLKHSIVCVVCPSALDVPGLPAT